MTGSDAATTDEPSGRPRAENRDDTGNEVRIVELPAPIRNPCERDPLCDAVAALDRENAMELWGYDDLAATARDIAVGMLHQEYATKRYLAAVRAGASQADEDRLLGYLMVLLPRHGNTHAAEIHPTVRPADRHRGIGGILANLGEQIARRDGRTVLWSSTEHAVEPPPGPGTLTATTESGRVRTDDPAVRFAMRRGWTFEQYERYSVLELDPPGGTDGASLDVGPDSASADVGPARVPPRTATPEVARLADAARAKAGADYRLHTWTGPTPDRWVEQVGVLMTRMSTDPPVGGLDFREDPWDGTRVRTWEREQADLDQVLIVTAVEHIPTGALAGFTVFACPTDRPRYVWQEDTLVLPEHRGRSLGMLVKTANLAALRRERPATRRIHTGNADENRYMLAINTALGFRPAGGWGMWQRRLPGVSGPTM